MRLQVCDLSQFSLMSQPDFFIADHDIGSFTVDMNIFCKVLSVADKVDANSDVLSKPGDNLCSDFDLAIAFVGLSVDLDRFQSGDIKQGIDFMTAGVPDKTAAVVGRVVSPGAVDCLLPVFNNMSGDGPHFSPATRADFPLHRFIELAGASLITDRQGNSC